LDLPLLDGVDHAVADGQGMEVEAEAGVAGQLLQQGAAVLRYAPGSEVSPFGVGEVFVRLRKVKPPRPAGG